MNNVLEIDLIIDRQKYSKIYNFSFSIFIIILITIYIIFTYKYQTYYKLKGRIINNEIELFVALEDLKYLQDNHELMIDNIIYSYNVSHINESLYLDENYHNYCYLYIKVDNLSNIDNFVYEIKIPKENKTLVKYLKDYL